MVNVSQVQGDQVIVIGADHALCMKAINLSVSSCYQRCYVSTVLLCVDLCDQSVKQLIYSTMHYLSPFLSQHADTVHFTVVNRTASTSILLYLIFQNSGKTFHFITEKSYFKPCFPFYI